ncbi:hypothetical protein HanPI659440_Chr08g0311071 [Helianthus annuus]|nr:hypothetical protein HanPI659440_Chr08g0311071 [Helianthus annuus]
MSVYTFKRSGPSPTCWPMGLRTSYTSAYKLHGPRRFVRSSGVVCCAVRVVCLTYIHTRNTYYTMHIIT